MQWRRFRLLNERELKLTNDAVRRVLATWADVWMHASKLVEGDCAVACEARKTAVFRDSDHWLGVDDADVQAVWICVPEHLRADLATNLFGERAGHGEARSELLPAITDAALRALAELLMNEIGSQGSADPAMLSASPPAREVWARGSGAVVYELRVGDVVCGIVLGEAWVSQVLAPFKQAPRRMPAPSDPRAGLEKCRVRLAVWAGQAEVELGLLHTLAPGDVVNVDLTVDQPMRVSVEGADSGRRVFLGRVGNRKAVQFGPQH